MKFIMVTNFEYHWDNLEQFNNETWFTHPMIKWAYKDKLPKGEVSTIFVKRGKDKKYEQAWTGTSSAFRIGVSAYGKPCIWFKVKLDKELAAGPELTELKEGWYMTANEISSSDAPNPLHPPFFAELVKGKIWREFEDNVYHLLRLLGIHDIHRFPQDDNRGKADGFFIFDKRLAVLYDATLDNEITKKDVQIENYVNQLKKEKIQHGVKTYTIKGIDKQVWIVTRNDGSAEVIKEEDGIKVKLVPVERLIWLYDHRLQEEISSDKMWDTLKDLE